MFGIYDSNFVFNTEKRVPNLNRQLNWNADGGYGAITIGSAFKLSKELIALCKNNCFLFFNHTSTRY
jgi:hypothetical protein